MELIENFYWICANYVSLKYSVQNTLDWRFPNILACTISIKSGFSVGQGLAAFNSTFLNHMTMMLVPLIVFSRCRSYVTGYYFHERGFGSHFTTARRIHQKSCFDLSLAIVFYPPVSVALLSILVVRKTDGDFNEKTTDQKVLKGKWATWFDLQSYRYFCTLGSQCFFHCGCAVSALKIPKSLRDTDFCMDVSPACILWDICEMLQKLILTGLIVLIIWYTAASNSGIIFTHGAS